MSLANNLLHTDDTIVALSTPPGVGAIGVVRLSGPEALAISKQLVALTNRKELGHRCASIGSLIDDKGEVVDQVILTYFPKPKSYSGEDIVEISCHGSPVILSFAVERAIFLGARLAEPGEFTQRAFFNGRIDLAQAEAVRDLVEATTLHQARVAIQQVEGALSRRVGPLKKKLCDLIALLEAGIDFAEDDVTVPSAVTLLDRLEPLILGVTSLTDSFRFGKVVRSGLTISILGRPNTGKSSLFNKLLEKDRSIISEAAGTTRDQVSEMLSIEGLPVKLIDTAGIRMTSDVVEAKGVEKSYEALADSDLILIVVDLSEELQAADHELLAKSTDDERCLLVGNKADLQSKVKLQGDFAIVSALTGEGVDELRQAIRFKALPEVTGLGEGTFVTNLRHQGLLCDALEHLRKAEGAISDDVPQEMLLLDLYGALSSIDRITGATSVDDILENIFSAFCIGK